MHRQKLLELVDDDVRKSIDGSRNVEIGTSEEAMRAKGLVPASFDVYMAAAGFNRKARRRIKTQLSRQGLR